MFLVRVVENAILETPDHNRNDNILSPYTPAMAYIYEMPIECTNLLLVNNEVSPFSTVESMQTTPETITTIGSNSHIHESHVRLLSDDSIRRLDFTDTSNLSPRIQNNENDIIELVNEIESPRQQLVQPEAIIRQRSTSSILSINNEIYSLNRCR